MKTMTPHTWRRLLATTALVFFCHAAVAEPEVVLVVSKKATVSALTRQQVADIFLGRTASYPNGMRVIPIDQQEGSDVREAFYHQYLGRSSEQVRAYWSKIVFTGKGSPPLEISSVERIKRIVRDNPNYIGYIDREVVDPSVRIIEVPH